jgi:hypothetical protein
MRASRSLPWAVRAAWAALPFTVGPSVAAALHECAPATRDVGSAGAWGLWALALVATLVPHPIGLTALRVAAPGAVACAFAGRVTVLSLGGATAAAALAFLPETGLWFVNGPAYPNERRFPLRAPGPLLLGPLELAWALIVGPVAAGALLVAGGRWALGGALLGIGAPVAAVLLRSMHGLSRRWLVFVPAGVVLHDPLSLADPVLFERRVVESLHPAPAGSDSLDLTQKAFGLALELTLREKVPMVLVTPGNRSGEAGASARLLFTPTRPGAVLAEAASRRIPTK